MNRFDVVVIGTGTAGNLVATRCAKAGMRVAIVDDRPFGGTCALRGCTPKKVLAGIATLAHNIGSLSAKGIFAEDTPRWDAVRVFKDTFTSPVPGARHRQYDEAGIEAFEGTATFSGADAVVVDGQRLATEYAVIASGAEPMSLGIPGEELLTTSDAFFDLSSIPSRLVCVGGGYISFEFAHIAARMGAEVTILHRGATVLRGFERRVISRLVEATRDAGIAVELSSPVTEVSQTEDGLSVVASTPTGERTYPCDCALHGGGRVPRIGALSLPAAGIDATSRGVLVNDYLQSVSALSCYAAGDAVAGSPHLKTVAELEGSVVADNIIKGNHRTMDYSVVPSVLFSIPEVASVGMTSAQIAGHPAGAYLRETDMSDYFSTRYLGSRHAFAVLVIEKGTERILGAHLMAPRAGEMANLFALAIRCRATSRDLQDIPWGFPTATSDVRYLV